MATSPLVTWTYSDWRSEATPAARLARLNKHLEEVSGFVLASSSKGRSLTLQQNYLEKLEEQRLRLERQIGIRQAAANRLGVSTFERGSGP